MLVYSMQNCADIIEEGSVVWEDNSELDWDPDQDGDRQWVA